MTNDKAVEVAATLDADISSDDVLRYVKTGDATAILNVVQDPETVARRIDQRILEADSLAALLGQDTVLHAQDYLNTPFQLQRVEWRPSDQASGLPVYAVLTIIDAEGEVLPMTCGARSVVLKLAKMDAAGWIEEAHPWLKISQSDKPTEAGNYPLDLQAAPAPF